VQEPEDGYDWGWGQMYLTPAQLRHVVQQAWDRYPKLQIQLVGNPEVQEEYDMLKNFCNTNQLTLRQAGADCKDPRMHDLNLMRRSKVLYISNSYFSTIAGMLANDDVIVHYPENAIFSTMGLGTCADQSKWQKYTVE